MPNTLMKVENLQKDFSIGILSKKKIHAVNNITFEIKKGEIISLIGESGSGKTTIGKLILRLLKPSSGNIYYKDKDINLEYKDKRKYYKKVQGIFQDPFASFNPLFKIDRIFDMIFKNFIGESKNKNEKIRDSLECVGMNPEFILKKYPHQLSGGQLQRLLIARALIMDVDVLIADELISMLDASTRIDVLNLLAKICKEKGMAVLFITHDLSLGYYISDTTLIMHKGNLVEKGETSLVYNNPIHPYTKMLLKSIPDIGNKWNKNEKFLPEDINKKVEEFYKSSKDKKGFIEVEKNHNVLFSL
ncbi:MULTISPECIES: ABC transporter ATP-binding protein [Oceanotoga]|uniref:Peptide/nickel transport system ATP-binding protein n=1 Tax=Oceanotoga teriensis TaxID=515440 RepID=A0AA45HJD6_9BACT|nr:MULTISPECIES: ABC transporter ATP-binding protein [Oceanotoga]MDN5341143.1 peptide/nickel transport system ATP-binding protein [Oceanotoga sp.]MDO7976825.1 ABC transporter ATP-binding protein [Oceanotoga teriensis]PWJ95901.1 peptide/nickel transport system ATP-binding protein [Oceanotoga teriensis]